MTSVDIGEVLKILGAFGRYQRFVFFLICFVMIPCAFVNQATIFLGVSTDHYCRIFDNQTYEKDSALKECSIPYSYDNVSASVTWEKCTMYEVNKSHSSSLSVECNYTEPITECLNGWVYDRSTYENTIVHEFDLVCGRAWLHELALMMVPLGKCVGSVILGQLSDILGRKHVFFTSLLCTFVIGFITTFSTGPIFYMIGQFALGFTHSGIYLIAMVIGIELVTSQHRAMAITFFSCFHAVGYITLSVLALLFRSNWQHLLFTTSLAWLTYFPYYWLLPESLRWLINKNRFIKAHRLVDKTARYNNIELPDNFYTKLFPEYADSKEEHTQLLSMCLHPRLVLRLCILSLIWFSISCTYYAIFIKAALLPVSTFVRPIISGIIKISACILAWWLVSVFGRRKIIAAALMFAGIAVLTAAFSVHPMVSATFAVISKFFLSMSYVIVILITLEMLPTDIRNVGVGVTYAFSSIGTILAPFILKLDELWKPLPFIVFSFLLVVMGLLSLVLPETKNQNLPQNLDEFEAIIGFSKAINKKPKQNDSTIGLMLKAETPSV